MRISAWLVLACAMAAWTEETQIRQNEAHAAIALKQLVSVEGVWRQTDSDRNGLQDYWTRDVAGFYAFPDAAGKGMKYIHVEIARGDARGAQVYADVGEAEPCNGYWFGVLRQDEGGAPYQEDGDGDGEAGTHPAKYAFCAYPAEHGKSGRQTLIINEEGVVYGKDLGADAREGIERWPAADPTEAGWSEWEEDAGSTTPVGLLKQLVSTEGVWRQTDSDRNGVQDYWTLDVAGFYYCTDPAGNRLAYVDISLAQMDRSSLYRYTDKAPKSRFGYWLKVLSMNEKGTPYQEDPDGDGKSNTCLSRFAFCAYPVEYGKTGTLTYIINEEGVPYRKDLGAEATERFDQWPGPNPSSAGWEPCED